MSTASRVNSKQGHITPRRRILCFAFLLLAGQRSEGKEEWDSDSDKAPNWKKAMQSIPFFSADVSSLLFEPFHLRCVRACAEEKTPKPPLLCSSSPSLLPLLFPFLLRSLSLSHYLISLSPLSLSIYLLSGIPPPFLFPPN
jgi:hypothetical protein